jgi:hypothetical protein
VHTCANRQHPGTTPHRWYNPSGCCVRTCPSLGGAVTSPLPPRRSRLPLVGLSITPVSGEPWSRLLTQQIVNPGRGCASLSRQGLNRWVATTGQGGVKYHLLSCRRLLTEDGTQVHPHVRLGSAADFEADGWDVAVQRCCVPDRIQHEEKCRKRDHSTDAVGARLAIPAVEKRVSICPWLPLSAHSSAFLRLVALYSIWLPKATSACQWLHLTALDHTSLACDCPWLHVAALHLTALVASLACDCPWLHVAALHLTARVVHGCSQLHFAALHCASTSFTLRFNEINCSPMSSRAPLAWLHSTALRGTPHLFESQAAVHHCTWRTNVAQTKLLAAHHHRTL